MSQEPQELAQVGAQVRASWQRFMDALEPLRPDLYRYCRHLTGAPWDAEDLAQDAMARAFVTLGTLFSELPEPRAWLFRVASNAWVDRVRRTRREERTEASTEHSPEPQASREAAGTLFVRLSPQERAALVLKNVFDFSVDEIAEVLGTTPGGVKAALHRARARLGEPAPAIARAPAPGVLEAFARAFNARDLEGLTALLLSHATVEIVGLVTEYGREAPKDPATGSLANTLAPLTVDERGGLAAELLDGYLGCPPRCEVLPYRAGWLLAFWYEHTTGPSVRTVMTVEAEGAAIRRLRNYFFSPDLLAEVRAELGVPYRLNGYRYWP